ncbi:MAG: PQQ-binding-like beta-propeller repeat protein [Candidatus Hydrogenedentota bacterium]
MGCSKSDNTPAPAVSPEEKPREGTAKDDTAPRPDVPWNTYHGDFSLRGVAETHLPEELTLAWRFMAGAPVITTPVAGKKRIYFINSKGRIYAVNPEGSKVWSTAIPREARDQWSPTQQQFDAPPTYFRETLLAGSLDGILFALDAASGEIKWRADLDGTILGAANIALLNGNGQEEARVYVIEQTSGVLHCLDFETGESIWQSDGVERCDGSPGVGGGTVVFGSCAAALHVFSADTGELLRNIPVGDDSQIAGGVAVIGNEAYSGSRSGAVVRADTDTGVLVWRNTDCNDEAFTTPAVSDEWVVFGNAGGDVYGLARDTGESQWTFSADAMATSAVIAGDKVVGGAEGTLFLLGLEDGRKLWSYEVSDEITSPALYGDLVLVGCDDGTVAAFH